MRLNISSKIALTVAAVVIVTVGAMAWITSYNLKQGFVSYLNILQEHQLDEVHDVLIEQYRMHGSFEWLRQHPRRLNELLAVREGHSLPPPRRESDERKDRPPFNDRGNRAYPEREDDRPPPPEGPPPEANQAVNDSPDISASRANLHPQQQERLRRPPPNDRPPPADPLGFGSRLSVHDAQGVAIIGPPEPSPGITRDLIVDGMVVGRLNLMPLRQPDNLTDTRFLQTQLRGILTLSIVLVGLSILLAFAFGRRLVRPVVALKTVTAKIAKGQLNARVTYQGSDELGQLAHHVNAMAEHLEHHDQQRRKMLADVSHELRTPLTVIRGEIEAMLDGVRKTDTRSLESLHHEVIHLTKLVNDLHQLAMVDAGDLLYRPQDFDLRALLDELLARHAERARTAGLQLTHALGSAPLMLHADRDRIAQVMTNLIENSIRYTDAGGRVVVTLARKGPLVEIVVEDSSPGVPAESLSRIFERLYRVDNARSRSSGGSGLGLSLCKAMIQAQGGSIDASHSVLGGLKMLILLPLTGAK